MRGRNRIKAEMSEYFRNHIARAGIVAEYVHGFEEMIFLNKAFALMLVDQKIIAKTEGKSILAGLQYVKESFTEADIDGKYEELYFNMEQKLLQKTGLAIGGKLHTGRSRNDIYATLWRMEARKSVWAACKSVLELQKIMLELAKKYEDFIITGYTHMQPAQPITLGYYYTAANEALSRDFARLQDAYKRLNQSPYGAAALAGTSFPIDRVQLANLLGFEGVMPNGLHCVGSRDYILEVEGALAGLMVNLSRVVQDHYIWSTSEFGYLQIGGEIAVCSSIMPQKKNPVTLEIVKAKAAHVIGSFVSSCGVLKNTPFSLCMDLFEVHSQYWSGLSASLDSLDLFAETLCYVRFNRKLAYQRAKDNFSTVTALADFLVGKFSISFSEAHDIVGDMVGTVLEQNRGIDHMNAALLEEASLRVIGTTLTVREEEIIALLEPLANVYAKTSLGGPGKEAMKEMLRVSQETIYEEEAWLAAKISAVEGAYERILLKEASL